MTVPAPTRTRDTMKIDENCFKNSWNHGHLGNWQLDNSCGADRYRCMTPTQPLEYVQIKRAEESGNVLALFEMILLPHSIIFVQPLEVRN